MDSVPRPLPAGSYQVGGATTTPNPAQGEGPGGPAPLARMRKELPTGPVEHAMPLREKAIDVGSRGDVKSSSLARGTALTAASRPSLQRIAELGAQAAQTARASGTHSLSPSAWFVALGVTQALPGLYRVGHDLHGPGMRLPPSRSDEAALARQAVASLALDPHAPLPTGEALVDQMLDRSVPPGAENDDLAHTLFQRLEGIEHHLNALVMQSEEPLDLQAPARRALPRLNALDQEIRSLLADTSAHLPAALRADLARLGERVTAERGFVQKAESFARAHDTGNLTFEGITAYMRHGVTAPQLHFLLFEEAVTAAYRASYVKGAPVTIPQRVLDGYADLWRQVARDDPPHLAAATPHPTSSTSAPSKSSSSVPEAPVVVVDDPGVVIDEPGYRPYDPGADPAE